MQDTRDWFNFPFVYCIALLKTSCLNHSNGTIRSLLLKHDNFKPLPSLLANIRKSGYYPPYHYDQLRGR